MAYDTFQSDKPSATSDASGTAFATSANRNDKALRDAIIALLFGSFAFSIVNGTGDARRPQYMYWKNGTGGSAPWIRATITWGTTGGEKYNPTSITWEYSANGGTSYDNILAGAQVYTWDANGNLTAITNGSSALAALTGVLGHVHRLRDDYDAHALQDPDDGVHGVGTLAWQDANAVAITDGTITSDIQRVTVTALGSKSAAFDIDCNAGHVFTLTVTGASAAATFINKPAAGVAHPFSLKVTNGGLATDLIPAALTPGGAALGLSSSGDDWVHGIINGSSVEVTGTSKAMG